MGVKSEWWWTRLNIKGKNNSPFIHESDVLIPARVFNMPSDDGLWVEVGDSATTIDDFNGELVCQITTPTNDKEIIFKQRRDWGLVATAERIAGLLYGSETAAYASPTSDAISDENTDRFQIGTGNNVWLHKTYIKGTYRLIFRYGMKSEMKMWVVPAIMGIFDASVQDIDAFEKDVSELCLSRGQ